MKTVLYNDEAREKLKKGVDLIANAVKVTLGPRGRNMIYGFPYGYPVVTKDGVTVARQVDSKDPVEQLGLLLIRQVAQKTADEVGDGTTTATLLAQEIFTEGLKILKMGLNPILLKRGMDEAVSEVKEALNFCKRTISTDEDIVRIASLSANNDEYIGALVADAVKRAGKDGVITIEDNYQTAEMGIMVVEGMQLNEGLISPYFITDPIKMVAEYKNAYLLLLDSDVGNIEQISGILDMVLKTSCPIIVVANNFSSNVLQVLVNSRIKNTVPIVAVKSPYFGEYRTEQLVDLAILTGARVFGASSGLQPNKATIEDLGRCASFSATRYNSIITGGLGDLDSLNSRISSIKTTIEKSESDYEKEKLRERLCKLTSGVVVIKVGAPSETEQKEKKMRVEDALLACKSAIADGVVPGGGVALLSVIPSITDNSLLPYRLGEELLLEEIRMGKRLIARALKCPILQLAKNSGIDGEKIVADIHVNTKTGYGYDFLNNRFGDLFDMGIIDPLKVVLATVVNAVSIASMLLTTEVVCAEEEEPQITRTPKPRSA